jgi:hypothetical protein
MGKVCIAEGVEEMKDKMSLAIDMSNAVNWPKIDNFTVLLLRLIMKADSENRMLLRNGFPVEVKMVEIFQTRYPYLKELDTDGMHKVDYNGLVDMAIEEA